MAIYLGNPDAGSTYMEGLLGHSFEFVLTGAALSAGAINFGVEDQADRAGKQAAADLENSAKLADPDTAKAVEDATKLDATAKEAEKQAAEARKQAEQAAKAAEAAKGTPKADEANKAAQEALKKSDVAAAAAKEARAEATDALKTASQMVYDHAKKDFLERYHNDPDFRKDVDARIEASEKDGPNGRGRPSELSTFAEPAQRLGGVGKQLGGAIGDSVEKPNEVELERVNGWKNKLGAAALKVQHGMGGDINRARNG
jgi:hypothetical protein